MKAAENGTSAETTSSTSVNAAMKNPNILELQKNAALTRLALVSFIALAGTFSEGVSLAFSTPAAIIFTTENATKLPSPLDNEQLSWFMSFMKVGVVGGTLISGTLADFLGRRMTLVTCQLVIGIGWAVQYFATDFPFVMIGRFILGFGAGIDAPLTYVYLSEIAIITWRSGLLMTNALTTNAAFMYTLAFAAYLSHGWLVLASCLPMAFFILASFYMPESPTWLLKMNRDEEAKEALTWIRGSSYEGVDAEISEIKTCLQESGKGMPLLERLSYLKSRSVLMPMLLLAILYVLQAFSGADTLCYYALDIFRRAGITMDNYMLGLLVQAGFTFGYVLSMTVLFRLSPRVQYTMSTTIMSLCGAGLAIGMMRTDQILMPICAIGLAIGYGTGVGPVPFSLMGEILPVNVMGVCSSILLTVKYWTVFLVLKLFPSMADFFGLAGVFWFHMFILIAAGIGALFAVPDTRGKSLAELADLYKRKEKNNGKP